MTGNCAAITGSRAASLPFKVDTEKVIADLKNGVLTVRMAKAADARPKQIAVKAAS